MTAAILCAIVSALAARLAIREHRRAKIISRLSGCL